MYSNIYHSLLILKKPRSFVPVEQQIKLEWPSKEVNFCGTSVVRAT